MIRQSRSRSSQSSSVHPHPQPIEGPPETESQPTPIEVGGIGSSSNSNIGKKRTRGRNRCIKLFNRRPDDKLIMQINAEGQPIGENARPFATLRGIIVRTPGNAPLQVTKWADVLEQAKEKMWKHIQSEFKELSATQGGSFSSIGEEIYTRVMGAERHGRVHGYGLDPSPTSVFGSTSHQSQAAFDERWERSHCNAANAEVVGACFGTSHSQSEIFGYAEGYDSALVEEAYSDGMSIAQFS
ncbi:hypothetical protein MRB53_023110 [Persea americana]|uniref:Uncharacterized protein n=1 Tax=Persea americana TaxID=3435 RepID=A0ACC2L8G7_PERAE|nr:hypothetical protein MRB53_023110 [Persea americana]